MIQWTFIVCDSQTGQNIAYLSELSNVSYSVPLNDSASLNFTIPTASPESSLIVALVTDIKVLVNDVLVFRGRITNPRRTFGDNSNITYSAYSYKELLKRKFLYLYDVEVYDGINTATDVADIGAELINVVQSRTAGTLNIRTDQYTQVGHSVTARFEAGTSIYDAINTIARSSSTAPDTGGDDQSAEWDIVPIGNDLVYEMYGQVIGGVWVPYRGKSEATYQLILGGSVLSGSETLDTSKFANYFYVEGNKAFNARQTVSIVGATSGTYTLGFRGATKAFLWNNSLVTFANALETMTTIGEGNVQVTGGPAPSTPFVVTFINQLAGQSLTLTNVSDTLVGIAQPTITANVQGGSLQNEYGMSDYTTSPYGRVEAYLKDTALVLQQMVDQRLQYLTTYFGGFIPAYTLQIEPGHWSGPADCWIGDFVDLELDQDGWSAHTTDLRCTSLNFTIGSDGEFSMSMEVGWPIPQDMTLQKWESTIQTIEKANAIWVKYLSDFTAQIDADGTRTAQEIANLKQITDGPKGYEAFKNQYPGATFNR